MSLNETPSGERVRIGFFGIRNAGKSSLVNAVCGQEVALASNIAGTTTDPVKKAMELLPLGPVEIIDTPGIDDEGELGEQRVVRTRKTLRVCDVAVLVVDASRNLGTAEQELISLFKQHKIPFVIVRNKSDLLDGSYLQEKSSATKQAAHGASSQNEGIELYASAHTGDGINELKEALVHIGATSKPERCLLKDLLSPSQTVVLVMPIDSSAPKGRIILPQQMALRDVLDAHASACVCQVEELAQVLESTPKVDLVVTDSQAFKEVAKIVPAEIPLTSFSILMARYKGNLKTLLEGAEVLKTLTDNSQVLISEGCTHHRQCEDIGTVKMPAWIREYSGANPNFEFAQGRNFPESLEGFDLIVHCGACMLNERDMRQRMMDAKASGVPMLNYGITIACVHGILNRVLAPVKAKV